VVERVPKTAPKGVVFCRLFTGTETYAVRFGLGVTALGAVSSGFGSLTS
jgi:hypothetical protein